MLVANEEGTFDRLPVLAVSVPVVRTVGGSLAVGDLPTPTPVPDDSTPIQPPSGTDVPSGIAKAASDALDDLGLSGQVSSGSLVDGRWRVVMSVRPEGGPAFAMVVHVVAP